MKQEELDPQDQSLEISTYCNAEIIQQHADGLLSRWEADVTDTLMTHEVEFSASSSSGGIDQAWKNDEQSQRIPLSQIYIRCLWGDVPVLRRWITHFLAGRQPDATIIASGMAKQGMTKIALNEQQAIEGYLVIGSAEQELYGSVAESVAEHLVAEGQITGYAVYTTPVILY